MYKRQVVAGAVAAVALAEAGRRRAGGRRVFPYTAALMAPLWTIERGVCSWIALGMWTSGRGVRYGGRRITVAANRRRTLEKRLRGRR